MIEELRLDNGNFVPYTDFMVSLTTRTNLAQGTQQAISTLNGFFIGAGVGIITATLGAYKDTTFEPFEQRKFWRSPLIASVYGAIGSFIFPNNESKVLLATFASTCERITVESWKATTKRAPGKFQWGAERDRGWLLKKGAQA